MSFFGKQGSSSSEEIARDNDIKISLTDNLKESLRAIQRQHVNSNQPIYSEDNANAICNVLEAIFLHGLKESFSNKFSSWASNQQSQNATTQHSFWPFLMKFTHRDVISQLNHLGQITTHVGMCRAWVRVALNDGLLESYLDAMLADCKVLEGGYRKSAYLRDPEQPGILKTYVQGLSTFTFRLSYNSRLLNVWTPTPLLLAGLLHTQRTPAPVVRSQPTTSAVTTTQTTRGILASSSSVDSAVEAMIDSPSQSFTPPPPIPTPAPTSQPTRAPPRLIDDIRYANSTLTPPNTPWDPSQLTQNDIDEIRKLALSEDQREDNSSTATSQISHPDPVDARDSFPPITTGGQHSRASSEELAIGIGTKTRKKGKKSERLKAVKEKREAAEESENRVGDLDPVSKSQGQSQNSGEIDQVVQTEERVVENEASHAVSGSETEQNEDNSDSAQAMMKHSQTFPQFLPRRKSEVLEPELSTVIATQVEVAKEQVDGLGDLDLSSSLEESGFYRRVPPRSNSLGCMQGWSSEFEDSGNHGNRLGARDYGSEDTDVCDTIIQEYSASPHLDTVNELLANTVIGSAKPSIEEEEEEYDVVPDAEEKAAILKQVHVQPFLDSIGELCTEKGLDMQNYKCATCTRPIGMFYGKARVCMYDAGYYCYECHENDENFIPSRIIHNWDFRKHRVCKQNLRWLRELEDEPLLNIQKINPRLYDHVNEINEAKLLRMQLRFLKAYLFTCTQSIADDLRKQVWPKEYYYDDIHLYSLVDLVHVETGQLQQALKKVISFASKHVYDCRLCSQKGFICEICNNQKVIYPFEMDSTFRCSQCESVFHKHCQAPTLPCPKCRRRQRLRSANSSSLSSPDDDYGQFA